MNILQLREKIHSVVEHADERFLKIIEAIAKDSIAAARKVKKGLVEIAGSLNDFPEKYSIEEYLEDEPEIFRSISNRPGIYLITIATQKDHITQKVIIS